jgi:hypothetical protein
MFQIFYAEPLIGNFLSHNNKRWSGSEPSSKFIRLTLARKGVSDMRTNKLTTEAGVKL